MSSAAQPAKKLSHSSIMMLIARYGILLVLVGLIVVVTILSPIVRDGQQLFFTERNLIQVMLQASINAIIAVGMTFVITSGGIDLSVGSIVALVGVISALLMRDTGIGPIGGFLAAIAIGALCGLFNAFLITRINLPPFIATLGTMGIFRGIALIVSDGRSIYGFDQSFVEIFNARIAITETLEIPLVVIVAVVVALIGGFILSQTKLGKYTVAIGGSEETTKVAGIPIRRFKSYIYVISGVLTGIAGVMLLARLRSGDPTFGNFFELNAIAAVVMGGTSLSGGQGTITGTIVGALIISIVQNAMNIFNVPSYWQQLVIGMVIVLAVMLDQWRKKQAR